MPLHRLDDSGSPLPLPDVQRTSFALDAMARFMCNTWDEVLRAQAGGQFDIIIIGSGMYGGYAAARLYELGRRLERPEDAPRILVLEAGPFLLTEHIQNVTRRGTPLGALVAADLVEPSQTNEPSLVKHYRCVGGKSLFWGGWCPRYQREDMQARDAETGERLWPAEVEEYLFRSGFQGGYEQCERELGVVPVQDFIRGDLYAALKARAETAVAANPQLGLDAVLDPPLAVQGESPGSGLFSFDKYSSVPGLFDSIREDAEHASGDDAARKLMLLPCAEALKLETVGGRVVQVVIALSDLAEPGNRERAKVVRLDLKSSAMVLLAGNTINSTRLAMNSFPRPAPLNLDGELMGRNLMVHTRSNHVWRVKRSVLNLPPPVPGNITTAALHVTGSADTEAGRGRYHFQLYAAPNMDVPMFPGASRDAEQFLYMMTPNIEDLDAIREAQSGLGNDRVVVGIRSVGECRGDRTSPIGSNMGVSWMSVNPFGGTGDDVYREGNRELRIPKAYVHLVKTEHDETLWKAQDKAAFDFMRALAGQDDGGLPTPSGTTPASGGAVEVLVQMAESDVPSNDYRLAAVPAGRFFLGRFGGQVRVLDGSCTHEGCPVTWTGSTFTCPCHTASFGADGARISGPPPGPLHTPAFRIQNGMVEVIQTETSEPLEHVSGGQDGIGTTYHECGTLWLGENPQRSVTDVNGRFHHVTNAYCIDQSIFPTAGSANPVLTGVTLTRKITTSIIERYVSTPHRGAEPGFTTLYHGNFAADGWLVAPGGSAHFFDVAHPQYAVLGAGVDSPSPALGVLWYSTRRFRNFVLRLDWRAFDISANSGVFLRMPQPLTVDQAFYDSSIEIQIDEHGHDHVRDIHGAPLRKTGAVYGVFEARQWAAKAIHPRSSGKRALWNALEIRLENAQIDVQLNGKLVSQGSLEALLPADAPSDGTRKRASGYLGLQCHSEVVQFRNIRICEL